MKLTFLTFANEKYKQIQEDLCETAIKLSNFDNIIKYTRAQLEQTKFYTENKKILDLPRGVGYWCWKPYIILETLNNTNCDAVFYMDCGDDFKCEGIDKYLRDYMKNHDILLTHGGPCNGILTKRDTFVIMNCDEPQYWLAEQIEAGICCFSQSKLSKNILEEWLSYCKNPNCVTDIENIYKPNFEEFLDHRHDQSILTNLAVKHKLPIQNEIRSYILPDVNNLNEGKPLDVVGKGYIFRSKHK